MCGIAGAFSKDKSAAERAVRVMVSAQKHRGPDGEGVVVLPAGDGWLALGHRRLSILDLSAAGQQPMTEPGGSWLTYNGEIYNFAALRNELSGLGDVCRTRTDSEVLLLAMARWGTRALERISGMFAFGYWSARDKTLLLARDPLGIKPLVWAHTSSGFLFASETQALLATGWLERRVDTEALTSVLAYGSVPAPWTGILGAHALMPGHLLSLTFAEPRLEPKAQRYWSFPLPEEKVATESLSQLLRDAVASHLVADVKTGVFLSAGIDSTAVATVAAQIRDGDLDTFTVSAPFDRGIDETPIAQQTAQALGVRHHAIALQEADVLPRVQAWLSRGGEPSVDGLNTFLISQAVRERGIVVALSGLGGDEVFSGYSTFRSVPRLHGWAKRLSWIPPRVRKALVATAWTGSTKIRRQKAVELASTPADLASLYLRRRRLFSDAELHHLGMSFKHERLNASLLPNTGDTQHLPPEDDVAGIRVLESRHYLANTLLKDADYYGMANSLEIRVPLLDRQLVEAAFRIPGERSLERGVPKPLLLKAVQVPLPFAVRQAPKRGFSLPYARWMQGPLRDLVAGLLEDVRGTGWVNPDAVTEVWNAFLSGVDAQLWTRVWMLAVLGRWARGLG
ncbi:MAG: asparagine synthase (glutamine-hydrolyzing) [Myxococcaceae bacterium]